jgi:hypothetical protein
MLTSAPVSCKHSEPLKVLESNTRKPRIFSCGLVNPNTIVKSWNTRLENEDASQASCSRVVHLHILSCIKNYHLNSRDCTRTTGPSKWTATILDMHTQPLIWRRMHVIDKSSRLCCVPSLVHVKTCAASGYTKSYMLKHETRRQAFRRQTKQNSPCHTVAGCKDISLLYVPFSPGTSSYISHSLRPHSVPAPFFLALIVFSIPPRQRSIWPPNLTPQNR